MADLNKKKKRMTPQQFLNKMSDLRDEWATDSNATSDPNELLDISEQFIVDMDNLLGAVLQNHPSPPPPRIRP